MWAAAVLLIAFALWLVAALRRFVLRVLMLCADLAVLLIRVARRVLWLVYPSLRRSGG
jgi:hypothetical protein